MNQEKHVLEQQIKQLQQEIPFIPFQVFWEDILLPKFLVEVIKYKFIKKIMEKLFKKHVRIAAKFLIVFFSSSSFASYVLCNISAKFCVSFFSKRKRFLKNIFSKTSVLIDCGSEIYRFEKTFFLGIKVFKYFLALKLLWTTKGFEQLIETYRHYEIFPIWFFADTEKENRGEWFFEEMQLSINTKLFSFLNRWSDISSQASMVYTACPVW